MAHPAEQFLPCLFRRTPVKGWKSAAAVLKTAMKLLLQWGHPCEGMEICLKWTFYFSKNTASMGPSL